MEYINEPGFYAFLRNCEIATTLGLTGPSEYRLRISYLRTLLDPNGAKPFLDWPYPENQAPDEDWDDENREEDKSIIQMPESGDFLSETEVRTGRDPNDQLTKKPVVRLTTHSSGALGHPWIFNKYDDDYFPSVPHGHLRSRKKIKLDAYRGLTYDTGKNNRDCGRESRRFIAALWNSQKFRMLATSSISYFDEKNPKFNWLSQRGISNPRSLPHFK